MEPQNARKRAITHRITTPLYKRWLYQATHRGTREADRLVGGFVVDYLARHSVSVPSAVNAVGLEALLQLPDEVLMAFILWGTPLKDPTLPPELAPLLSELRLFVARQAGQALEAGEDAAQGPDLLSGQGDTPE